MILLKNARNSSNSFLKSFGLDTLTFGVSEDSIPRSLSIFRLVSVLKTNDDKIISLRFDKMGIKELNPLIKKYAPAAMINLPNDYLYGKRIAIDTNWWLCNNMSKARKNVMNRLTCIENRSAIEGKIRQEWIKITQSSIFSWLKIKCTPVFVFDGPGQEMKEDVRAKRKEDREKRNAKIERLFNILEENPLDMTAINDLKKEMRLFMHINTEDYEYLQGFLEIIGMPVIYAKGDGEKLCASLCIEKKVAAVYSQDVDVYPYGCPLTIVKADYGGGFPAVRLDTILDELDLNHAQFIDLCIMCGCDFNNKTRIRGIGIVRSLKLIKEHGYIDYLPHNMDVECLKHGECREMFRYCPSLVEDNLNVDKQKIYTAREYLNFVGASDFLMKLNDFYNDLPDAQDGHIEELELQQIEQYIPKPVVISLEIVESDEEIIEIDF